MTMTTLLPGPGRSRRLSPGDAVRLLESLTTETPDATAEYMHPEMRAGAIATLSWAPEAVRNGPTGFVRITAGELDLVMSSSFPLPVSAPGARSVDELADFITSPRLVAIVLLRYGAYSVGLAQDGGLLISKSDTRYVKGQHRAGGQSQRRFERNREKWVRELFDKACVDFKARIGARAKEIDYLALGGDPQVLIAFLKRCPEVASLANRELPGRLQVDRPNTTALKASVRELWTWRFCRR